ncbi:MULTISPECIES: DUF6538 domain-containing protein [Rhodobacterales]|uniref:DUF6538 domain-containing protein n=1 Tax=Rhodobacterales TaxID=204455 RepID=UPI003298F458
MPKRYKVAKRSGTDNLQLRYYVPVEYQEAFGKREVVRSLKTTDSRLAHERALDVVKELDRKVKAAQTSNVEPDCGHFYEPSHEKIEAAAREVYESEVEADWEERSDPEHMRLMGLGGKISAKSYKREAKKLRQAASMGDFSVADIEYWSDHFGFQFPANNVKRNRFHKLLAYAYAEAAERWAKHDMGKRGGKPTTPELRRPKLVAASPQGDTRPQKSDKIPDPSNSLDQPTLGDLWDSHERQRGARVKPATLTDRKVSVRLFADYLGQGTPVTSISKEDARNWRDLLYKLPTNSAQR